MKYQQIKPRPKSLAIGDRVVLNEGHPNEMHGTVVNPPVRQYYVRWDDEYHSQLTHPVGPYDERRLHLETT
jgi:hypothetical protein